MGICSRSCHLTCLSLLQTRTGSEPAPSAVPILQWSHNPAAHIIDVILFSYILTCHSIFVKLFSLNRPLDFSILLMNALKANFSHPRAPSHFPRFRWTFWVNTRPLSLVFPFSSDWVLASACLGWKATGSPTAASRELDLGSICLGGLSYKSLWLLIYKHIANFPSSSLPATKKVSEYV